MSADLIAAAQRAADDPEVRAVLLRGAGGTFCVGGDVKSMAENKSTLSYEQKRDSLRRGMEISRLLHEMTKPVVAQIDGAAAGAGLSIALSCDLRVVGASAKITTAFAKVGLSGDFGGTYFLTQLVGSAKAKELYLLSDVILAEEAERLGIVNRAVDPRELEAETMALAKRFASGARITQGLMKKNLNIAEKGDMLLSFDTEALNHSRSAQTADHAEAAKAFVEKRAPVFKGR